MKFLIRSVNVGFGRETSDKVVSGKSERTAARKLGLKFSHRIDRDGGVNIYTHSSLNPNINIRLDPLTEVSSEQSFLACYKE